MGQCQGFNVINGLLMFGPKTAKKNQSCDVFNVGAVKIF